MANEVFWLKFSPDVPDTTAPVVSDFTVEATSADLNIDILTLVATDDSGTVSGYLVNESATPPLSTDPGWDTDTFWLTNGYDVGGDGVYTLYAWAIDPSDNVSALYPGQSCTVTFTGVVAATVSSAVELDHDSIATAISRSAITYTVEFDHTQSARADVVSSVSEIFDVSGTFTQLGTYDKQASEILQFLDQITARTDVFASFIETARLRDIITAQVGGQASGSVLSEFALDSSYLSVMLAQASSQDANRLSDAFSAGLLLDILVETGAISMGDAVSMLKRAMPQFLTGLSVGAFFDGAVLTGDITALTRVALGDVLTALSIARPTTTETSRYDGLYFAGDIVLAIFGEIAIRPAIVGTISVNSSQ